MKSVLKTMLMSVAIGWFLSLGQSTINTPYLSEFLRSNLVVVQITLLAINAATLSVVLTKLRDLLDRSGRIGYFEPTKKAMLLSINEQLALIVISILLLMVEKAPLVVSSVNLVRFVSVLLPACLAYSLFVLYDTTRSVFLILDYRDPPPTPPAKATTKNT